METKTTKKTNDMFTENSKTSEWFSDATSAMIENYKKQMDLVFGFYNNAFNSAMGTGRNPWNITPNYTDLFSFGNNPFKAFFNPFLGFSSDGEQAGRFSGLYEKLFKQVSEYNKHFLDLFQNNFQVSQEDWVALNEKYQHVVEEELNSAKTMMQTLIESYNKQLDFLTETNKELQSELNKQFNKLMKTNQEFWSEAVKTQDTAPKEGRHKHSEKKELSHSA
jgi:hypothetical protein